MNLYNAAMNLIPTVARDRGQPSLVTQPEAIAPASTNFAVLSETISQFEHNDG